MAKKSRQQPQAQEPVTTAPISYNNSGNYSRSRSSQVPLPEIVDIETLGYMLDEDLYVRLRALEEGRGKAYEAYIDMRPWEEELAYIRREQQIRRVRQYAHNDYCRALDSDLGPQPNEDDLPAGDFDNSAFVYAATGGRMRWN